MNRKYLLPLLAALFASFTVLAEPAPLAANDEPAARLDAELSLAEPSPYDEISRLLEPDLWKRIRRGFGMPQMDHELVSRHEYYYLSHPAYLSRLFERSGKYLYFVVGEAEKRGIPTEVALLPMIESAYNPQAYSHAHASGLWQFIPSTGKHYGLEQTWWYDGRRDIFAATQAALDYLSTLYVMFGDWHLALASYNWGEGAVARAVAKNEARGAPTDYFNLNMPAETRNYVPKLMALRNIVAEPERYGVELPPLANKPYFTTVTTSRHMDLEVAARMADLSVAEFLALNPAYNQPVIAYKESRKLLVPIDRASLFRDRLANSSEPLLTWQPYQAQKGDTVDSLAERFGGNAEEIRRVNHLAGKRPRPGLLMLVPRANEERLLATLPPPNLPNMNALDIPPPGPELSDTPNLLPTPAVAETASVDAPQAAAADKAKPTPPPAALQPAVPAEQTPANAISRGETPSAPSTVAGTDSAARHEANATPATVAAASPPTTDTTTKAPALPPQSGAEKPRRHRVAAGETAYGIARQYGLSIETLLKNNNLSDGKLKPGQELQLTMTDSPPDQPTKTLKKPARQEAQPKKRAYIIQKGDTLTTISRRFKVDMRDLMHWNGLKAKSTLRPGETVLIHLAKSS